VATVAWSQAGSWAVGLAWPNNSGQGSWQMKLAWRCLALKRAKCSALLLNGLLNKAGLAMPCSTKTDDIVRN